MSEDEKVWQYPDLVRRFMRVVTGCDNGFYVSDGTHLGDFGIDDEDLLMLEREFGTRLPTSDLYLWEALMMFAPKSKRS